VRPSRAPDATLANALACAAEGPYNVLFLCTGNAARSILAESIVNHEGAGRFVAFSAGSFPKGAVHPVALKLLNQLSLPTGGLRSKSWQEFAVPGAPRLDFILTVCDNAAGEVCPVWPGRPTTAHWGLPDPAAVDETAQWAAFRDTYRVLERRIRAFMSLPLGALDRTKLQTELRAIAELS